MRLRAGFRLLLSMYAILQAYQVRANRCSVGAQFVLGSWYKKNELGTRAAVFASLGQLGSMAGGWIQAGLLVTLQGTSYRFFRIQPSSLTLTPRKKWLAGVEMDFHHCFGHDHSSCFVW